MKIVYDMKHERYFIKIEESEIYFNTSDISKVRLELIERMTKNFDDAICEKFEDDITKYLAIKATNKICQSEEDHEWECCGISNVGCNYRCKKCGAYKMEPYSSSTSNIYKGERTK